MKLFIFGAGASKGSQEAYGYEGSSEAPTVDELFDEKYSDYAAAVGLERSDLVTYRESFQKTKAKSLELWLTDLWEQYADLKSPLSRQQNRIIFGKVTFYIRWLMQNVSDTYSNQNGYKLLLQKLGNEGSNCGFINFNYDTLFDRALMDSGIVLADNLSTYKKANYIKPHGSVNWFLQKRDDDAQIAGNEQSMDNLSRYRIAAAEMYKDSPIPLRLVIYEPGHNDLKNTQIISSGRFGYQYGFPFMLVPLSTKLYGHFDRYQEEILFPAKQLADQAEEIYLIGYRASDEIIKDIFQNVQDGTTLHVIGRSDAQDVQNSVLSWMPSLKKGIVSHEGFVTFIKNYPN